MTYICAGKGSPGLGGWVGVAAGVGRRTSHPSILSGSGPPPSGLPVASVSSPRAVLAPARSCLWGKFKSQASSGAVLLGGQGYEAGGDAWASQCHWRLGPGRGDTSLSRGVGISAESSFLLIPLPPPCPRGRGSSPRGIFRKKENRGALWGFRPCRDRDGRVLTTPSAPGYSGRPEDEAYDEDGNPLQDFYDSDPPGVGGPASTLRDAYALYYPAEERYRYAPRCTWTERAGQAGVAHPVGSFLKNPQVFLLPGWYPRE